MIRQYVSTIRKQMQLGDEDNNSRLGPRMLPLSLFVAVFVSLYIVASIFVVPPSLARDFNFVDERGSITALSALFLAAGCGFAFATLLIANPTNRKTQFFWFLVSVGLGFLVLDELLEFHERIGDKLDKLFTVSVIRGWNDIIVMLYGAIAIPVGLILLPTMARYRIFLTLMVVAFGFYLIHTAVDSFTEPPTTSSVMVEESAKLFSTMCISLACLSGLFVQAGRALKADAELEG